MIGRSLLTRIGARAGICIWLAGCATVPEENASSQVYWPKPPNLPRFAWESVIHAAADVERKQQDDANPFLAASEETQNIFVKPVRIAAQGGRIFVTDTLARRVHVFDAPRQKYYQMGFRREGILEKPLGIALDKKGMVYVADSKRKSIVVYDQLGMWIKFIGDAKTLHHPVGVAVTPDGDRIYVIENGSVGNALHRMVIFNADGQPLGEPIGRRGRQDGEFNLPTDIALGPDGRVYVVPGRKSRFF
ncbi:MAG: hypothetical protein HQM03_18115 [Magnetococcales bacterium]|nr:hypothetical protein [Magnetococcales bacterium]